MTPDQAKEREETIDLAKQVIEQQSQPMFLKRVTISLAKHLISEVKERERTEAEIRKWKDEYQNVCKFATDYENQLTEAKAEIETLRKFFKIKNEV